MAVEEHYNELMERELLLPYHYLLQVKGKQMRSKIPSAFNYWLNVPNERLQEVIEILNMLHVASLLFDDIQDDAKCRLGLPAAHCVYGVPLTINPVMHLTCLVFKRAHRLNPRAGELVMEQCLFAVRGQGYEVYWRDNFICPTEEQYYQCLEQKTGAMFMLAVKMIQLYSDNKTDYSTLATHIGKYFQLRDDYCNLLHQEALEEWPGEEEKKTIKQNTFCEDITEGKFSLSIIHAMKTSEGKEILDILRKRTEDIDLKKHCVALLEKTGSLQYTRDKLSELDQEIRTEVTRLGGNPLLEEALDQLLDWKS